MSKIRNIDLKLLTIFFPFAIIFLMLGTTIVAEGLVKKIATEFAKFNATLSLGLGAILIALPNLIKGGESSKMRKMVARLVYEVGLYLTFNIALFLASYTENSWDDYLSFFFVLILMIIIIFEAVIAFKLVQDSI
ncbi:hypothetical protein [Bacillus solimangrovi]|uniref:Uncharacterized protein n=1 Tax=Bacillus solimangrovi TaxID=1305675 RepID=A0A1E5LI58_9BACI|nr:hypothetical protein [Bacillus solimangrovi]OEH93779.1 hypothetical protein BFG57_11390 [Bacillus solimangrovi]